MHGSIFLGVSLKCYKCSASDEKSCLRTEFDEVCSQDKDTCITLMYAFKLDGHDIHQH